jgi:hypothetical protein
MTEQSQTALPFETPSTASRDAQRALRARLSAFGGRAVFWSPVWVPLTLLAQIALQGLGPALAESRRLGAAEQELGARLEHERETGAELQRALRAQNDPIYLERERRLLQAPEGPLQVK